MISSDQLAKIADYWTKAGVRCEKATLRGWLAETDLARLWSAVGMPAQEWWIFNFDPPAPGAADDEVAFGFAGEWRLLYRPSDGSCFEMDLQGRRIFANSSIWAFAELLTVWDKAYRRIQEECAGDTGADWDTGDAIVDEMKREMIGIDPRAFQSETLFWPSLIVDLA